MLLETEEFIKLPQALANGVRSRDISIDAGINKPFTVNEQKIYLCMLQSASRALSSDTTLNTFSVEFAAMKALFPALANISNSDIEKTAMLLTKTTITVPNYNNSKSLSLPSIGTYIDTVFNLVTSVKRFTSGLEFKLNDDLMDILQSKDRFTKLSIDELNAIGDSSYSIPMYSLAKHYENGFKTAIIPLAKFRSILGIPEDSYVEYKRLKSSVIDRIIKDINANTSITIELYEQKAGKKVIGISISVKKNITKTTKTTKVESIVIEKPISTKAENLVVALNKSLLPIDEFPFDKEYPYVSSVLCNMSKDARDAYAYKEDLIRKWKEGDPKTVENVFVKILNKEGIDRDELTNLDTGFKKLLIKQAGKVFLTNTEMITNVAVLKDGTVRFEITSTVDGVKTENESSYKEAMDYYNALLNHFNKK